MDNTSCALFLFFGNWEYSGVDRNPNGFYGSYTDVYFDDDLAVGKLDLLRDMVITDVGLYTETGMFPSIEIQSMRFEDGGRTLECCPPIVEEVKL